MPLAEALLTLAGSVSVTVNVLVEVDGPLFATCTLHEIGAPATTAPEIALVTAMSFVTTSRPVSVLVLLLRSGS